MSAVRNALLVEDERGVQMLVAHDLTRRGFHVRCCGTAAEALRVGMVDAYDVVLLDVGLGDESGIDVCRRLRAAGYGSAIIMLSGNLDPDVKTEALYAGADDYVTKPFHGPELVARIDAVTRRLSRSPGPLLEVQGRLVRVNGVPVKLTATERAILLRVHSAGPDGLPRAELLELLSASNPRHALDEHVSRIRKKLGDAERCLKVAEGRYWTECNTR